MQIRAYTLQILGVFFVLACVISIANCRIHHHHMWPGSESFNRLIRGKEGFFDEQRKQATDSNDRTDSLSPPDDTKSINDAAISFLFALKFYPFRNSSLFGREDETSDEFAARQLPDSAPPPEFPDLTDKKDNHRGILAVGVDVGLPGDSGFGYGEEWPFRRFFPIKSFKIDLPVDEGEDDEKK